MATKAGKKCENAKKPAQFVRRFVFDVISYTLKKCGLPESSLPFTDCAENVYPHGDLVNIAGVSALRIALIMRDKWKRMFVSRRNSYGFSNENVQAFLEHLIISSTPSRTEPEKYFAEQLLASCNEIIMYFHLENIDIDFNILFKFISEYIVSVVGTCESSTYELFDSFEDLSGYTEWITQFVSKFVIPYGSRDDVSVLFLKHVRRQYSYELRELKDCFRFLPHDLFLAVTVEEPKNLTILITGDDNQLNSSELPESSSKGAVGRKKSSESLSKNVPEQSAERKQSRQTSSGLGIEHGLGKMCLDAEEACRERNATEQKHKTTKDNSKKTGS